MDPLLVIMLCALLLVFGCGVWRLVLGPSLPDRILALDFMAYAAVGFMSVLVVAYDAPVLLDVAIALALVAFLGTVAFAHFIILNQREDEDER